MTKKGILTLATGSMVTQPVQSLVSLSQPQQIVAKMAVRMFTGLSFRTLTPLMFFALSAGLAHAQTLVIDINVSGLNSNQTRATGQITEACNSLVGDTSDQAIELQGVCDLINSLDPNDPEDAARLEQIGAAIAPEEAFALSDSVTTASHFQTSNVHARLHSTRTAYQLSIDDPPGQQTRPNPDPETVPGENTVGGGASADLVSPLGVFINGHVSSGKMDGGDLQQDADIASSSLTVGSDYRLNKNIVAGVGIGFVQDESNFSSVAGGSRSDGVNLTAFGSWSHTDQGYLDVVLDFGRSDYTLERSVSLDPDTNLIATSSPVATATSITVSGGRNFKPFGMDLSGYGRLSYTGATIDSYSESLKVQQPGFAALYSVGSQTVVSTKMVVGFNLTKAFSFKSAVLLPLLRLEYVRENDEKKDVIEATLISTGTKAQYEGEDRVGGYSNLGIGTSAVFRGGRSAYAFYETHLHHDTITQNCLKAGVRLEF